MVIGARIGSVRRNQGVQFTWAKIECEMFGTKLGYRIENWRFNQSMCKHYFEVLECVKSRGGHEPTVVLSSLKSLSRVGS